MDAALAETRLKNMTAWNCPPELSQADIDMLLLLARRVDVEGRDVTDSLWVPTYHLDWAAAEAWAWKAGAAADRYKVLANGVELNRQQIHDHARKMYDLYTKKAANQPRSIRSVGNLVADRLGAYTPIPWWWEAVA